jgi:hypothetical protein
LGARLAGGQVAKFHESSIRRHERVRGGDFLAIRHTETGCYLSVRDLLLDLPAGDWRGWPKEHTGPRPTFTRQVRAAPGRAGQLRPCTAVFSPGRAGQPAPSGPA